MPSPFQPAAVRIFYRSPAGIVARWNNVLFQYRNGPLEPAVFDSIVRATDGIKAETEVGAISILDGKASIPSSELRAKQREVANQLLSRLNGRIALVVTGEDVWTQLLKSFARLVVMGNPRATTVSSVDAAIKWLAPVGETTAADLQGLWRFVQDAAAEDAS